MNGLSDLHGLLTDVAKPFRKGPEVVERETGGVRVVEVWGYPPAEQAPPELHKVDVHFFVVGVDLAKARKRAAELDKILETYPDQERLAGGPSYIESGAVLGSQEDALLLYGVGEAIELWHVITPEKLGITGTDADELAGKGLVMIEGYKRPIKEGE